MDREKFGAFIAVTRRQRGMTQQELAKKLSVTNKAVSRWETAEGFPDITTLEPLAHALGISLIELMRSERLERLDEKSSQALSDTIELANLRRDRRVFIVAAIGISLVGLMIIALAVFVPCAPTVWTLPFVFCTTVGICCLCYALHNRRKKLPSALWFAAAGVLLFVPAAQLIFLLVLIIFIF